MLVFPLFTAQLVMSNQNTLLTDQFIADACLTAPLPKLWLQLPAQARLKRQLSYAVWSLLLLLIVGVSVRRLFDEFVLAGWSVLGTLLALLLWGYLLIPAKIAATRYLLRSQDFLLQSGLWWRQATLLPLSRVQHVRVSQGPLQKRFGLKSLQIYTAGGQGAEVELTDIRAEDADAMCTTLSALVRLSAESDTSTEAKTSTEAENDAEADNSVQADNNPVTDKGNKAADQSTEHDAGPMVFNAAELPDAKSDDAASALESASPTTMQSPR